MSGASVLGPGGPLALEAGLGALMFVVLMLGLFRPKVADRRSGWVAFIGLAILTAASFIWPAEGIAFGGSYVTDALSVFARRLFLASAAVSVLAGLGLPNPRVRSRGAEYHFALLASLMGMLILACARDLVLLFVAFEMMSIPLYFLAGFEKGEEAAPEGALKFFLLGTVSSAILLYGLSFVVGATGSTEVGAIAAAMASGSTLARLGLAIAFAGLGFKIAAVPFHMWVPDAYEAALPPFVAWLSVAPKAAGFMVILRLYIEGAGASAFVWAPLLAALSVVTIMAGNLMAIPQRNVKRMLAYSGVAHIGYLLMGLAALSADGVAMLLFYLVAYLFANMGAFLVVQAVGSSEGSDRMAAYRGLAQRSPVLALGLLVFLLSLGGIPFVAGFWAKLFVFRAVIDQGMYGLALVGAVATIVALYYYLVLASRMYVEAPEKTAPVPLPPPLFAAILICAVGVVVMGVYPQPWVDSALAAAKGLFRVVAGP